MLCPIIENSNTIELTVHKTCCFILDLLGVTSVKAHHSVNGPDTGSLSFIISSYNHAH